MGRARFKASPIIRKWVLLTYDIPKTQSGDKARREFLAGAKSIGATQQTQSVYLLPRTQRGIELAEDVARIGDAFLWITTLKLELAEKITRKYDKKIKEWSDQIVKRIDKIEGHIKGHPKLAQNMAYRTEDMLDNLEEIISRRRSAELYETVLDIKTKLSGIIKQIEKSRKYD